MSDPVTPFKPEGIARCEVAGHKLLLHPHLVTYICDHEILVCSDLHMGKAAHFRRHGIPVPEKTNQGSFWRIVEVIECFRPRQILFLGDILHSSANREWEEFIDVLEQFPRIDRVLVRGNHDVEPDQFFAASGFEVVHALHVGNLRLIHEPDDAVGEEYTIAGHLHPAVFMRGKGRQNLRLPCFWFGKNAAVMPAFGEFTGTATVSPIRGDKVFVVAENQVIRVS